MRRQRTMAFLFVALATLLLAAPALAVETMVSNFKVTFYGFIQTHVVYSDKTPTAVNDAGPTAPPANSFRGQHDDATISARTSRVGFRIEGPGIVGAKSGAQVEFDFRGDAATGAGGSTVNAQPRLRLAKFLLDWGNAKLTVGQFWNPISGIDDTRITLAPGLQFVTNSGFGSNSSASLTRMPQVRLNVKGGPLSAGIGIHRPEQLGTGQIGLGSQSGLFGFHSGIRLDVPQLRGTFLEVVGEFNRQESNPSTGGPEHANIYIGSLLTGTRWGPLFLRGQLWYSQNAFVYDHTFGQGALASTTTAGSFSDIHALGYWLAATVDLTRTFQVNAGWGAKEIPRDELTGAKQTTTTSVAGVTTNFKRQYGYWANAVWALGPPLRVGVEYIHVEADYFNGGTNGSLNQYLFQATYLF
ncbi:MAG: porin [Deltaproteobacteria bacterium]|nr:porin [Deltaproteobacteria bacterium]